MAKDVNKVEAKRRGPSSKSKAKARHAIVREEQSVCHHYPLERTEEISMPFSLYYDSRLSFEPGLFTKYIDWNDALWRVFGYLIDGEMGNGMGLVHALCASHY
jgi:hypothetical protein